MFATKRLSLRISLFASLLGVALVIPLALASQGSAASSSFQYTTMPPDPSAPLPVKEFEVDRHYNYHIPSDEEVVANKQKLMKEDKFKDNVKKVGQQQAERELDARIKADIDYMKEKNQLGSEKIPMLEIGEHSAYVSKYTYSVNTAFQCTDQIEDPVNLFFYDTGWTSNVVAKMTNWLESPFNEDHQCAYTSNIRPGPNGIGDLEQEDTQVYKGDIERDHMRMWGGGLGNGPEAYWSIGSAHHEDVSWSLEHCLIPHVPDGSSFDLAEYHVWNDALGSLPHFFYNAYNANSKASCGYVVEWDGTGVGVHITSDTLWPGNWLAPGMTRYSADGRFAFTYQTDGNLVLYQYGGGGWYPIWAIDRFTSYPGYAVMQTDGNLVTYDSGGNYYWYSGTNGYSGARLVVQSDGNVVIYLNSTPIWSTGTCCR